MPRKRAKARRAKQPMPPPPNPQGALSVARLGSVAALAFVMASLPVVVVIAGILLFVFDVIP